MIKYLIEDYVGKTFSCLTVLSEWDLPSTARNRTWKFVCECGNVVEREPSKVILGRIKSCGCREHVRKKPPKIVKRPRINPEIYIGKKSNRLTAIAVEKLDGDHRKQLLCLCDCGNYTHVYPYQFASGKVQSCGCAKFGHSESHKGKGGNKTHGLSKNPFYKRWIDMVRRCHNESEPAYRFYGAKGISVCEEWRYTPDQFIKWCEETCPDKPGMTLDRTDGHKGYSPENCRWITQQEQVHNLTNNRFVTVNGITKCVTDWCKTLGTSPGAMYKKVHKGSSFEEAVAYYIKLEKWEPPKD